MPGKKPLKIQIAVAVRVAEKPTWVAKAVEEATQWHRAQKATCEIGRAHV